METVKPDSKNRWEIIVIGAGQAGLATGYYLSQGKADFVILDSESEAGSSWKKRWDSLRLFTPAQYDSLPGLPFPGRRGSFPSKDDMAGYLAVYAQKFNLPIRWNVRVNHLRKTRSGFELETTAGKFECRKVVVATGTNPVPKIPSFAGELDRSVFQLHSSQYRNPDSLPPGKVLVVGAGTSGTEIAIELAESRETAIAGRPTFHIPDAVFRYAGRLYWWFANHVLTVNTPVGRKARNELVRGGGPLVNVSVQDLDQAGVTRLPRVATIREGHPELTDGCLVPVSSVLWATGFKPDFSWIEPDSCGENGWPAHHRGISTRIEGLFFVGLIFQFGLTSGLVGGVGRDARYVARRVLAKD